VADLGWQRSSAGAEARQERQQFTAAGERHQWEDELVKEAREADYNGKSEQRSSILGRLLARIRH